MPLAPFLLPPSVGYDNTVAEVLAWLALHMDVDCVDSAVDSNRAHKPLVFQTLIRKLRRNYLVKLKKMPDFYWLQEFTVFVHPRPPISAGPLIVTEYNVEYTGGFYHVIIEKLQNGMFLTDMVITRC